MWIYEATSDGIYYRLPFKVNYMTVYTLGLEEHLPQLLCQKSVSKTPSSRGVANEKCSLV